MKIPGTLARKRDPIEGRTHRRGFVVEYPEAGVQVNPMELLFKVAGYAPAKAPAIDPVPTQASAAATALSNMPKRIRAYLAKVPGAVAGQDGHDSTFHVACILTHG